MTRLTDAEFARLDFGFIEAAHYEREATCQPWHPVQGGNGTINIEHIAPTSVPVLALPMLACMAHGGLDHACTHVSTIDDSLGTCDIEGVRNPHKYAPADMVEIVAVQHYTGRLARS